MNEDLESYKSQLLLSQQSSKKKTAELAHLKKQVRLTQTEVKN